MFRIDPYFIYVSSLAGVSTDVMMCLIYVKHFKNMFYDGFTNVEIIRKLIILIYEKRIKSGQGHEFMKLTKNDQFCSLSTSSSYTNINNRFTAQKN